MKKEVWYESGGGVGGVSKDGRARGRQRRGLEHQSWAIAEVWR